MLDAKKRRQVFDAWCAEQLARNTQPQKQVSPQEKFKALLRDRVVDGRAVGGDVCIRFNVEDPLTGGWRSTRQLWSSAWSITPPVSRPDPACTPSLCDAIAVHGLAAARATARYFEGDIEMALVDSKSKSFYLYLKPNA